MNQFKGFSTKQKASTIIPSQFYSEVLPNIQDIYELKIILYAFWYLSRSEAEFPFLLHSALIEDDELLVSFGQSRDQQTSNILEGLKLAVEDKIFLKTEIRSRPKPHTLYFINTQKGRKAIKAIEKSTYEFDPADHQSFKITMPPKNIFVLYEENIGPLTPMIAEALTEIEKNYSYEWIEEAFQEALKNNVRKLRYIEAILINWQEAGKHDRTDRRRSKKTEEGYDPDRYINGEYSEFIDH
jgi:DnaD/phage-associated family protein